MTEYTAKQHAQITKEEKAFKLFTQKKSEAFDKAVEKGKLEHTSPMFRIMMEVYTDIINNFDTVYFTGNLKNDLAPVLEFVGPEAVANLVADKVVIGAAREKTRQDVVDSIKEAMLDTALEGELMNLSDKEVVNRVKAGLKKTKDFKGTLDFYTEKFGIETAFDIELMKLNFGFVNKVVDRIKYFEYKEQVTFEEESFEEINDPFKDTLRVLSFTNGAIKSIKGLADDIAALRPSYRPLVCQARDWTAVREGGYYTEHYALPLVKSKGTRTEVNDYYKMLDESEEFIRFRNAVNEAQKTSFKINRKVLALSNKVKAVKGGMFDFPSTVAINTKVKDRKEREELEEQEKSRSGKLRAAEATMKMAGEFKKEEEIYFVYQADFRGRIYNVCTDLNTQGDDLSKAMLLFSEGKKLGEDGYFWLCIHAANLYGADIETHDGLTLALDKVSFKERYEWIQDNEDLIKLVAKGDIKDRKFREALDEAENPFMFYATCQELVKVMKKKAHLRKNFVSYIPVGMDGSCNGQQWAAGFLRSAQLAENVNLNKSNRDDRPNDLYSSVRDAALEAARTMTHKELAEESSTEKTQVSEEQVKELVEYLLSADRGAQRKLFKRCTMTEAYAVTVMGQREMLWIDWKSYRAKNKTLSDNAEKAYKAVYGKLLAKGLEAACMASRDSMDFLKSCARAMGSKDIYMTNPMGFTQRQSYRVEQSVTIQSRALNNTVKMQLKVKTDEVNTRRQQSAIAPNFTHSQDSAHMLMVVERFAGQNMSWMLIHDDYATHAGCVTEMNKVIRETFVEIHSSDRLNSLKEELIAQGADESKFGITRVIDGKKTFVENPLDLHNDFDLNEVTESTYFFA